MRRAEKIIITVNCAFSRKVNKIHFCKKIPLQKSNKKITALPPPVTEREGPKESIVFRVDFKVGLGMGTGRADLRGLGADDDMAAVAALPNLDLALGEDLCHLHVL